jgi:hypothetical protein
VKAPRFWSSTRQRLCGLSSNRSDAAFLASAFGVP